MSLLAPVFLLFTVSASAQVVGGADTNLYRWDGGAIDDSFGWSVANAGDVNQDGFDDIIIGAYVTDPGGLQNAGSAYVYSGADGSLLYQWDGTTAFEFVGISVDGAGDTDGDGFDDLLVGASGTSPSAMNAAGSAFLYSGRTGALLFRFDGETEEDQFGYSVSSAGDLNADGFPDVLVGAYQAEPGGLSESGSAYAYSGNTGTLLFQWVGQDFNGELGNSVSSAGDINADGFDDVIIGAHSTDPALGGGLPSAGSAFVFSGADGSELYRWDGAAAADFFGGSVSGAGDINADGFDDVLIGAHLADPGGLMGAGSAYAYSGADGSQLYRWDGETSPSMFGISVSGAGDVNGDGFDDLLVGALTADISDPAVGGSAYVYSGRDGGVLLRWVGEVGGTAFGSAVSSAGDVDGDGLPDILIGAPGAWPNGVRNAGSAFVYSFHPFLVASANSISASAGSTVRLDLDFPDAAAFDDYKVLLSTSGIGPSSYGVEIPLTADQSTFASFTGSYPFAQSADLQGTLDATGNALAGFRTPVGLSSAFIGSTLYLAAIANSPGQLPEYSSVAVALEITL